MSVPPPGCHHRVPSSGAPGPPRYRAPVLTAHGAELPEFLLRGDAQPVLQHRHPRLELLPALGRREHRLGHAGQRAAQRHAGVGAAAAVAPTGRQPAPTGAAVSTSPAAGTGAASLPVPPVPRSPPGRAPGAAPQPRHGGRHPAVTGSVGAGSRVGGAGGTAQRRGPGIGGRGKGRDSEKDVIG